MTHKNRKKSRIFMFLSTGCSPLRFEGFSCSLGVLYVDPKPCLRHLPIFLLKNLNWVVFRIQIKIRERGIETTVGTSDFDGQMSGITFWKGDEILRPVYRKRFTKYCILDFLVHEISMKKTAIPFRHI